MKCTALLIAFALTAAASAADDTVTFDAALNAPSRFSGLTTARFGTQVKVKVLHANTFVYHYKVAGQAIDYHAMKAPAPLAALIVSGSPGVEPIAPTNAPMNFGLLAPLNLRADEPFRKALENYSGKFDTLRLALSKSPLSKLEGKLNLDSDLDALLYHPEWDNEQINEQVQSTVRAKLEAAPSDSPATLIRLQLIQVIKQYQETLNGAQEDLDRALVGLQSAELAFLVSASDPQRQAAREIVREVMLDHHSLKQAVTNEEKTLSDALAKAKNALEYVQLAQSAADSTKNGLLLGPIEVHGDRTVITLSITPTDAFVKQSEGPGAIAPETATYTDTLSVYGRQVLDFSAGPIYSGLQDASFYKDSGGVVRKGVHATDDLQVALFAHWYETVKPGGVAISPTIGVGTDANRARLLFGASLVFGGSSRTMLTVGLARGKVTRLNGMSVGDAPTGDVRTRDVDRYAPFVGLSFSFITR